MGTARILIGLSRVRPQITTGEFSNVSNVDRKVDDVTIISQLN